MTNGVAWVDWPANTSAKDRASEDVLSPDIHPLAEIFPPMSDEEIKGLIDDIRTNGLRDPIILFEDKVGAESVAKAASRSVTSRLRATSIGGLMASTCRPASRTTRNACW
jgi:hypothetical protein